MPTTTRINLLSTPRNVSTAFMYSFASREDVCAVDEPFYAPWLIATGVQHPGREETLDAYEQDAQKVIDALLHQDFGKPVLFVKNMCPQLVGVPWDYMTQMKNVIFIREPAKAIISYAKVFEPDAQEMGTLTQLEIFHFLQQQGCPPIVLNSAELLKNPREVLTTLCDQLDIPFDPAMLRWEAGPKVIDGVWAKYWYGNAHASTEFRTSRTKTPVPEIPEHLIPLYNQLQPAYEELAQYTIRAE
ncbi:MAG: sulfotransferase family protein [Bacteroidota bacterium]